MGFVDLMIWPWFERLPAMKEAFNLTDVTKERFPKLTAWSERMLADTDVKATCYSKELLVKFFNGVLEGNANYDEGL